MLRIGFQGEIGAFSELAANHFFSEDDFEAVPCSTFEALFNSLSDSGIDEAVVPIENSLFGSVHTNYDLLREHDVHIVAELKLRVRHHLLVLPGVDIEDIRVVLSHPQALGQCREFLTNRLPKAEIVPAYDTAGAAKQIAAAGLRDRAAIASEAAAREYGLHVAAKGVESNHENYTRFLRLRRGPADARDLDERTRPRTSIVYAMRNNVPGALFKSLAIFALRELDLLKIESRPLVGSPFEYLFYLDFRGSIGEEPVLKALDHLEEIAAYVKILGSYPTGPMID